jgi:hypothetical protein
MSADEESARCIVSVFRYGGKTFADSISSVACGLRSDPVRNT